MRGLKIDALISESMIKNKVVLLLLCTPLIVGCTSTMTALRGNQEHLFDEMRTEIADLKHALHGTEVELRLLEEKFENQDRVKPAPQGEVSTLQRKLGALEKNYEKLSTDVKSLMTYANQTTTSLSQYRDQIQEIDKKLSEVSKLRSTLTQISKTYSETPASEKTYRVKSGDSLEKIARKFQVSTEALKRDNRLSSDKIVVGQELTIPSSE